ncbi:hypothetical protein ACX1NA_00070 [Mycoplasma sp. VS276A1]
MNLKRILFTCAPLASLVALPLATVSCNKEKTEEQKLAEEYVNLCEEGQKLHPDDPRWLENMLKLHLVDREILEFDKDKQDAINKEIERLFKERNTQPLA